MMRYTTLANTVLGFIHGIAKHYANTTLQLDAKSYPSGDLTALFQKCVDAANAAKQAELAHTEAVKAANEAVAAARPVAKAFKKLVLASFGASATILADFGLEPPKEPTRTVAVKKAASDKALATRKALHTMGTAQRKQAKKALKESAPTATDAPAEQPKAGEQPAPAAPPAPAAQPPAKS